MRSSLLVCGILSVLLNEGNPLSCELCISKDTSCTGSLKSCSSSEDACVSLFTSIALPGSDVVTTFVRSCGISSNCNKTFLLSNHQMTLNSSATCCMTDKCIPLTPTLPSSNNTLNGLTCQSCVDESSSCYTANTTNCTGEETKCIRYAETATGSLNYNFSMRGCATPSFCDLGNNFVSAVGASIKTDLACTNKSIRLLHGIFLPALTCILLLAFF